MILHTVDITELCFSEVIQMSWKHTQNNGMVSKAQENPENPPCTIPNAWMEHWRKPFHPDWAGQSSAAKTIFQKQTFGGLLLCVPPVLIGLHSSGQICRRYSKRHRCLCGISSTACWKNSINRINNHNRLPDLISPTSPEPMQYVHYISTSRMNI